MVLRNGEDERLRDLERRASAGDEEAALEWWTDIGEVGHDEAVSTLERRLEFAGRARVVNVPGHGRYLPDLGVDYGSVDRDLASPQVLVRWMLTPAGRPSDRRRFFFAHGRSPRVSEDYESERGAHAALVAWMAEHPELVAVHHAKASAEVARQRHRLREELLASLREADQLTGRAVVRLLKDRSRLGPPGETRRNGADEHLRDLERRAETGDREAALEWFDDEAGKESLQALSSRLSQMIEDFGRSRYLTAPSLNGVFEPGIDVRISGDAVRGRWFLAVVTESPGHWVYFDYGDDPSLRPRESAARDEAALTALKRWMLRNPELVRLIRLKAAAEAVLENAKLREQLKGQYLKVEDSLASEVVTLLGARGSLDRARRRR